MPPPVSAQAPAGGGIVMSGLPTILATILAAVAVLGVIERAARRLWHWGKRLAAMIESTSILATQLDTNGGSSLRDDMTHVVKAVTELQCQMEAHGGQIRELQSNQRRWF